MQTWTFCQIWHCIPGFCLLSLPIWRLLVCSTSRVPGLLPCFAALVWGDRFLGLGFCSATLVRRLCISSDTRVCRPSICFIVGLRMPCHGSISVASPCSVQRKTQNNLCVWFGGCPGLPGEGGGWRDIYVGDNP